MEKKDKAIQDLYEFRAKMLELFNSKKYISRTDYSEAHTKTKDAIDYFETIRDSGMLLLFAQQNNKNYDKLLKFLMFCQNIDNEIDNWNQKIINHLKETEKEYLDNILKDVDPNIMLDDEQRDVVLSDEDYSLVIAGAGAGKTTTVAAKIKYLVEKKHIDPKDIIVFSFTNDAVGELRTRVNKQLKIPCEIATFHSVGYKFIRKDSSNTLKIADEDKLYFVLQDYFKNSIMDNETMVHNLVLFFSSYFDVDIFSENIEDFFNKLAKGNYTTMRSELDEYKVEMIDKRTKKLRTIQNEVLRSQQEVVIANFLYMNNIDYEYEPIYEYNIPGADKPYTPDFIVKQGENKAYIEHFGITQSGENPMFSADQVEWYKKCVKDKVRLHKEHGTKLIYTFSGYNNGLTLTMDLENKLKENGFILNKRSDREVLEKLIESEENVYVRRLINLICIFIHNFKTNGYDFDEFEVMYRKTQNVRSRLFLLICQDCYNEYQRYLKENHTIDFEDMINKSSKILEQMRNRNDLLNYKYIIVDEYQDISMQRFNLVQAMRKASNAKIMAVGDDWQSIYAFSGSNLTLFTEFERNVGHAKQMKINSTYRNSQELIDIAGNFVQANDSQIKKTLRSPKHIKDPVVVLSYTGNQKRSSTDTKTGINYQLALAVQEALEQIRYYNVDENKHQDEGSVLLVGRFGFDASNLTNTGLFEYVKQGQKLLCVKFPNMDITFMTAHASKGLGFDNTIIVNCKDDTYGFPSKIEDDPILNFVIKRDKTMEYAEERRLFYVAMTRTKNRLFVVAPEENPSEFLLEIIRNEENKNILVDGPINMNYEPKRGVKFLCPNCGFPLQYRAKPAYGLKLWICSNEPEVCGFMTNKPEAGRLEVQKCPDCQTGYLVVKQIKDNPPRYILGCTNYKSDGTGCRKIINKEDFYRMKNYKEEDDVRKVEETPQVDYRTVGEQRVDSVEIIKDELPEVPYKETTINNMVFRTLDCINRVSEIHFFGNGFFADVLKGNETDMTKKWHLQNKQYFGCLKMVDYGDIRRLLDWFISHHYLIVAGNEKYPTLRLTNEGYNYSSYMNESTLRSILKYLGKEERIRIKEDTGFN